MALHYFSASYKFHQDNDVQYFLLFWELPTRLGWRFVKDQVRKTELSVGKTCDRVLPNSIPHVECLMRTAEDAKLGFDHFVENGMTTIEDRSFLVAWARRRKGKPLEISERERYIPPHLRMQRPNSFHRSENSLSSQHSGVSKASADNSISHFSTDEFIPVQGQVDSKSPPIIPYSRAVTISGLPDNMTSAAARRFVSKWGDVVTCVVHPPSVCKVQFEYAGDVINVAKHLHGTFMNGRRVQVRSQAVPPSLHLEALGYRHAEPPSAAATTQIESRATPGAGGVAAEEDGPSISNGEAASQGAKQLDEPRIILGDSNCVPQPSPLQCSQPSNLLFLGLCSGAGNQNSSTSLSIMPPSPTNSSESLAPITDSEGRSIVGCDGRKSIRRITFVRHCRSGKRYRQGSSDTDSDAETSIDAVTDADSDVDHDKGK